MSSQHFLVVGAGSVGRRHLQNLAALGCRTSIMDLRSDRLDEAANTVPVVGRYRSLVEALERSSDFDGVVVCSPPKFHVEQAIAAITSGLPVFLEKPVAPELTSALQLQAAVHRTGVPLVLGYTYRWWPPLQELKRRVAVGEVGAVRHVHCVMSAHLADWHPWEDYRSFFMASRDLGGGALLDESHFIDLLLWFFGKPEAVSARVEKLSALEIETDDNVDALLCFDRGCRASVHLDLYGRPHEKFMRITGDSGSLYWSFDPNVVRHGRGSEPHWDETRFTCVRNDMFLHAIREFQEVTRKGCAPSCTIDDGVEVMRVIEAMRCSSAESRTVSLVPGN